VRGQRHALAAFNPPGKTQYPLYRRLGGSQGRSGRLWKISPPPAFDPRTFQPVANNYTDWATGPTVMYLDRQEMQSMYTWYPVFQKSKKTWKLKNIFRLQLKETCSFAQIPVISTDKHRPAWAALHNLQLYCSLSAYYYICLTKSWKERDVNYFQQQLQLQVINCTFPRQTALQTLPEKHISIIILGHNKQGIKHNAALYGGSDWFHMVLRMLYHYCGFKEKIL
jgi:hypothetical protein